MGKRVFIMAVCLVALCIIAHSEQVDQNDVERSVPMPDRERARRERRGGGGDRAEIREKGRRRRFRARKAFERRWSDKKSDENQ